MPSPKTNKKTSSNSRASVKQCLVSAAAGGAVGAVAGLLLAPKSGAQMRRDLGDTYQDIREQVQGIPENHTSPLPLVLGAIGGGILGATVAYFAASESVVEEKGFKQKFQKIGQSVAENVGSVDWLETAKGAIDAVYDKVHHSNEDEDEDEEEPNRLNNILEWAQVGYQIWQNMQKRR